MIFIRDVSQQIINIKNGVYNKKVYGSLILSGENILLEGEDMLLLTANNKAIVIQFKSIATKLAEVLEDDSIYINGMDAVPEGRERELLQAVL